MEVYSVYELVWSCWSSISIHFINNGIELQPLYIWTLSVTLSYLKRNASETAFCLFFRWSMISLRTGDRLIQSIGAILVGTARNRRQNEVSEILCFKWKTGRWRISRFILRLAILIIYHRHKPIKEYRLENGIEYILRFVLYCPLSARLNWQ